LDEVARGCRWRYCHRSAANGLEWATSWNLDLAGKARAAEPPELVECVRRAVEALTRYTLAPLRRAEPCLRS